MVNFDLEKLLQALIVKSEEKFSMHANCLSGAEVPVQKSRKKGVLRYYMDAMPLTLGCANLKSAKVRESEKDAEKRRERQK